MTPEQAYEVIYKATGTVQLDRANHKILEDAMAVIAALVAKPEGK